tara:strand:+ start:640 stop:1044 length:405 start_codon:yes stop_codon:yes gene_type:complete
MAAPYLLEFKNKSLTLSPDTETYYGKVNGQWWDVDFRFALILEIENTGANPLTDFAIQIRPNSESDWWGYLTVSNGQLYQGCSGNWVTSEAVETLAAGDKALYGVLVPAGMRLRAMFKSELGTTLSIKGSVTRQ